MKETDQKTQTFILEADSDPKICFWGLFKDGRTANNPLLIFVETPIAGVMCMLDILPNQDTVLLRCYKEEEKYALMVNMDRVCVRLCHNVQLPEFNGVLSY